MTCGLLVSHASTELGCCPEVRQDLVVPHLCKLMTIPNANTRLLCFLFLLEWFLLRENQVQNRLCQWMCSEIINSVDETIVCICGDVVTAYCAQYLG